MEAVGWILRSSSRSIGALRGRTVAVIGDVVADEFVYGRVARVSREAPVLILEYDSTEVVPGGGGNAANNVAALGGRATLVGVVGRDEPGRRCWRRCTRASTSAVSFGRRRASTPVKTRILAGGIHSAKQQVVRIDRARRQRRSIAMRGRSSSDTRSRAALARRRGAGVRLRIGARDPGAGVEDARRRCGSRAVRFPC